MSADRYHALDKQTRLSELAYTQEIDRIQNRFGGGTVDHWWDRWQQDTTARDDYPTYFARNYT
ncbi:hypothetical protein SAMN04488550_2049 [Gordonia malaquae]|uniref:Uncharacterized protein n=1 Tax=Gordonia malaquae NBRC 108250 TaxID=1223542 RepID=M3VBH1_GORML|nr:hypothetical protein GM1_016_00140 [Gordonia malaquae NBRC 108250]SEC58451.1 hypothetical protein SAMN04488550_2049 [Gordonia malaquae]